jgi:FHS family L-fucose permease-like MFS transporter
VYSTGAILFWPCAKLSTQGNHKAIFGGFVVCTAVMFVHPLHHSVLRSTLIPSSLNSACGLATLETSANSYITVLPQCKPEGAAFRLQFSQSFNGIASFAGPFIASKYFFSGGNSNNLTNVQWVYLAVSGETCFPDSKSRGF